MTAERVEPERFIGLLSALCRHYHWEHDFWRRMGRRQFYAWVEQALREKGKIPAEDPHSWEGTDADEWWQNARRKRDEALGR